MARSTLTRRGWRLVFALALLAAITLALLVGPMPIAPARALALLLGELGLPLAEPASEVERVVLVSLRAPRVLVGGLVGAALACGGAALQAIFRNPLADPQLIGVASGAALAAALVIVLGSPLLVALLDQDLALAPLALAAFAGALLSTRFVVRIASVSGRPAMAHMLLAGIAVNALAWSGVGALQFAADDVQLRDLSHWMLGEVGRASWAELPWLALVVIPAIVLLQRLAPALDVSLLGDAAAHALGVELDRLRRRVLLLVSAMVALAVACTGPIGFVGLAVPHVLRLLVGGSQRGLYLDAALLGAALLIAADALARIVVAPAELPVGILTSLLGAPLFLSLLLRDLRDRS